MAPILFEEQFEVPANVDSLEDFRRWMRSDGFPDRGRIDFIAGRIEVDMSPESMYSHGGVKAAVLRVLLNIAWDEDLGEIYCDQMRIASAAADLSAEPDVMFLSHQTLDSDRIRLVPKSNRDDDFIEIDGPPDMVAESVSDSSVVKDTQRLPAAYFAAGVQEYWLIDARGDELLFQIQTRGQRSLRPVDPDGQRFQASMVFGRSFRLVRRRDRRDRWKYTLEVKPLP